MPVVAGTAFTTAGDAMSLVRSLLNDIDFPFAVSTITASGAVRASNVTTFGTLAAHGLAVGQRVVVASVTDSTFNGTFTILSVPTSSTFTVSNPGANGTSGQGTVELINPGDVFTDTVLLPLLNKAYRKVQRRLLKAGSKTMTGDAELGTLTAGGTDLTDTSTPQLPADFVAPREIFEKEEAAGRYVNMGPPLDVLPDIAQGPRLVYWTWREEGIFFIGATANRDLRLRYYRTISDLVSADSQIAIRGGGDAVASACAAIAAGSKDAVGTSLQFLTGVFEDDMTELLSLQASAGQYQTIRRRRYTSRPQVRW